MPLDLKLKFKAKGPAAQNFLSDPQSLMPNPVSQALQESGAKIKKAKLKVTASLPSGTRRYKGVGES